MIRSMTSTNAVETISNNIINLYSINQRYMPITSITVKHEF
jgi:hypothetical protein